jgi:uncharacterized protein YdaU (DUF1376 family)
MRKVRHVDFYPDDWISGIAGLTLEEQGLYWLICAMNYGSGEPVDVNCKKLKTLAGVHGNKLKALLKSLENAEKLVRNDPETPEKLWGKRCEKELKRARNRQEKGEKAAGERWNNNGLDDAQALPAEIPPRARVTAVQPTEEVLPLTGRRTSSLHKHEHMPAPAGGGPAMPMLHNQQQQESFAGGKLLSPSGDFAIPPNCQLVAMRDGTLVAVPLGTPDGDHGEPQ